MAFQPISIDTNSASQILEAEVVVQPGPRRSLDLEFESPWEGSEVVTVEDAATGIVLHTALRRHCFGAIELPMSRYRLHVDDGPLFPVTDQNEPIVRRRRGRMTREVDLLAEDEAKILVEIPNGSRISLRVEGEWTLEDAFLAEDRIDLAEHLWYVGPVLPPRKKVAEVFMVPKLGSAILVEFAFASGSYSGYADHACRRRNN